MKAKGDLSLDEQLRVVKGELEVQVEQLRVHFRQPQYIHEIIQPALRSLHEKYEIPELNNEIMKVRVMADACWKSSFYRLDHAIHCSNHGVAYFYSVDRHYQNPFFKLQEGYDFLVTLAASYIADGGDIFPAIDCMYHAQKIANNHGLEIKENFADFVTFHKDRIIASLKAEESLSFQQGRPIYNLPYGVVSIEMMLLSVLPAGSEEHNYLSQKARPLSPPGEFERWEPQNLPQPTSSIRAQFFYTQQQAVKGSEIVAAKPAYG